MVIRVSKRAIDAVFEGLFLLTDIRAILRETAPLHELDEKQKMQIMAITNSLVESINAIREDLLK